jgi:hypothetical protein
MPGHQVIIMHSLLLLRTMWCKRERLVCIQFFFNLLVWFIITLFAEELLIDFQELIGEHSGENMATTVWKTLETYNIQDKVRKINEKWINTNSESRSSQ